MQSALRVTEEVRRALAERQPVVGLESTIFSHLGLPSPANAEALDRSLAAVRSGGAVPAITAVLDGVARVGVDPDEHERILGPARKTADRDLPLALAQQWGVGATTVSASLRLCAAVGVKVFTTGGIGGVHHGAELSGDISADLPAIASLPVVTVCAGAKSFLDLGRTVEWFETNGVPLLGWQTDRFPAFYAPASPFPVAYRVETPEEVAGVVRHRRALGQTGGVLVAAPIPAQHALGWDEIETARQLALAGAEAEGLSGPAVTPWVLARLGEATDGRSIPANLSLAENNAMIAARVASALA
ncbi:MAG: pseudouridine-5'-phosphate glycosidase [Actinomycetia bacterium]|nr:pseudouridine-5'-phosphate glycosidase [Actinomycetes bacterium]